MEYISEKQIHEEIRTKKQAGVLNSVLMKQYGISYPQLVAILNEK